MRNNTQVYNAKDTEIVMPMNNLIEYSDNYSKTSGSWLELSRIQKICQSSILMLLDLMGFLQEFYYLQQGMGNM